MNSYMVTAGRGHTPVMRIWGSNPNIFTFLGYILVQWWHNMYRHPTTSLRVLGVVRVTLLLSVLIIQNLLLVLFQMRLVHGVILPRNGTTPLILVGSHPEL